MHSTTPHCSKTVGNICATQVSATVIGHCAPASDRAAFEAIERILLSPPPEYSLRDVFDHYRGVTTVPSPKFDIPIFFIQGTDHNLPQPSLAEELTLLDGGCSNPLRFFYF